MVSLTRRMALGVGGALLAGRAALAAGYPARVVRLIVPYPAGGSNDIVARISAQMLGERDDATFIVENRDGASGNIGAQLVAGAEPDGYTLLLTAPPPLTINNALFKRLNFDAAEDFAPVAMLASVPIVLVANASLGVHSVAELIALAKTQPGKINFGSAGIGSTSHLAGQLFRTMTGIDIVHVPYRGEAPAINDLIAGVTQMMFSNLPSILPQIQATTVTVLAVAGAARARALPDVPTVAEAGVLGFKASAWFGLVAPARTPEDVTTKVIGDCQAILLLPAVQERLSAIGAEPGALFGEAFRAALAEERVTWSKIIADSGVKAG